MKRIFSIIVTVLALVVASSAMAGAKSYPGDTAPAGIAAAQQTATVVIKEAGPNKVKVIKIIRTYMNVELRAAKDMVDAVEKGPVTVAQGIPAEQAAKMEAELKEAGAKVEVK